MAEKKKFLLRIDDKVYAALEKWAADDLRSINAVSYTHLTLPTSDLVQISVVAVSLKKKKHVIRYRREHYTEQHTREIRKLTGVKDTV